MSTELRTNDQKSPIPHVEGLRVGIAVAEWNSHITESLLSGAVTLLKDEGYNDDDILICHVPGTVELTYAAAKMIRSGKVDVVIVFGCVIRGGTPHFDYVCDSITQGVTYLNATEDVPVIFGILTTDNEQQALDRAGGSLGNKGTEAAEAALKMVDFACRLK